MKKLFFVGALLLSFTFSFASNNVEAVETNLNLKSETTLLADCKVTIKDNETGKSHTITIHGKSCGDLIKDVMK
ncbi:hypothetical protein OAT18_00605 [Tenacibaculum sp.]|nr:hypothetical protein [Tenacibaculum sp.]